MIVPMLATLVLSTTLVVERVRDTSLQQPELCGARIWIAWCSGSSTPSNVWVKQ